MWHNAAVIMIYESIKLNVVVTFETINMNADYSRHCIAISSYLSSREFAY